MLTREDILKMEPGRELDALVAEKVMGFERADDDWTGLSGWKMGPNRWSSAFKASTDISAAWEVVEKIKQKQKIEMWHEPENDDFEPFTIRIDNKITVGSESAPLAICRAALLAVMEESHENSPLR